MQVNLKRLQRDVRCTVGSSHAGFGAAVVHVHTCSYVYVQCTVYSSAYNIYVRSQTIICTI